MASWYRKKDSVPFETAELIVSGILPIVLIIVGTLGNMLCVIILLKKEHRQTSTNVYLIFLCTMDMLSLYQWNLRDALYQFTDGKLLITNQSLFLCIWHLFLAFYTLHTSAMFLTLIALDRACLLWSRWYKQKIARARIAFIFSIVIFLVLFGLDGFIFGLGFEYQVYDNSTATYITMIGCYYSMNMNLTNFFANQYAWIHLVIMYFIPFTVMFFCTIMTVRKLSVQQTFDNQQLANNAQRNRRISIMLLMMFLSYVIFTLPNRLCFSIFVDQLIDHDYSDTVFLSSNVLMYTRNALNVFLLYVSVYGFRRDVRRLLNKCYGKMRHRIVPQQGTRAEYIGTITMIRENGQQRIN
ncbi:hypothetical protein I4U23_008974 [Adineta vaga]|nr:hypothetical protein I4U23_008974 [Adineta vaga]